MVYWQASIVSLASLQLVKDIVSNKVVEADNHLLSYSSGCFPKSPQLPVVLYVAMKSSRITPIHFGTLTGAIFVRITLGQTCP